MGVNSVGGDGSGGKIDDGRRGSAEGVEVFFSGLFGGMGGVKVTVVDGVWCGC